MEIDYKEELKAFLKMRNKDIKTMCIELLLPYGTFKQTAGYVILRLAFCKYLEFSMSSLIRYKDKIKKVRPTKQEWHATLIAIYLHKLNKNEKQD
ncbi:MAG: hypothetical protein MK076_00860 [Flavobacteriales bacterium]|nr:hypothetical protein [Flavobacteriales bacterium]